LSLEVESDHLIIVIETLIVAGTGMCVARTIGKSDKKPIRRSNMQTNTGVPCHSRGLVFKLKLGTKSRLIDI
jgi:hypothetical protein